MNKELINEKYNKEEIRKIADKIHEEFNIIFFNKDVPTGAIRNLARILECYPQTNEDKMYALELAAYIKYEVVQETEYVKPVLSSTPQFNKYRTNAFAVKKALSTIYNYEDEYKDMPRRIEESVKTAESLIDYEAFNYKRLSLNNK